MPDLGRPCKCGRHVQVVCAHLRIVPHAAAPSRFTASMPCCASNVQFRQSLEGVKGAALLQHHDCHGGKPFES
jgi:hypothetical protein